LDKWLWAARFFKTRSIAANQCDLGRIESNGQPAKPAREVRVGDRLRIRTPVAEYQIDVVALSEIRGPSAAAQALYSETAESREQRAQMAEARKANAELGVLPEGRPTKRDRRQINKIRGRW
jgi:ribosome-associated heat shock protein Hsp15